MKAIQYQAYGGYQENRLVDLERPIPKDGEVLVEMRAGGINPLDNTFRSGHIYLSKPENLPRIGGQTGAGVVVETRSADFKTGDRVFVKGPGLGLIADGTWREYVAEPAVGLAHVPADLDDDHAAAFLAGAGYLTGYLALTELAKFKPGQTVLAPAIGSAVGMETVQIARCLSASLTITAASTTEKAVRARADGYEHVIDLSNESLKDGVLRITGGKGVDIVVDGVRREVDRSSACIALVWRHGCHCGLRRRARSGSERYRHYLEGRDDSGVHVQAVFTGNSHGRVSNGPF